MYGVYRSGSEKMETTLPVEGSVVVINFRRSIIIAQLWQPEFARRWKTKFLRFLSKNDPLRGNFPYSVRKGFIATSVNLTCCVQISWNLADGKSVKSCVAYLTKTTFLLALQLSLLGRSRPKSARASPRECTQSAPAFIQIGSLSVELFPNAWTPSKRAVKCFQHSAEAWLKQPILASFIIVHQHGQNLHSGKKS